MPSKLEHALDAAARGLPVFPQQGKRPSIRAWPTNATLKPSVIERWWTRWPNADIGIALPKDIYVLDADNVPAGQFLSKTFATYGETLTVWTARGLHAYYKVEHELRRLNPLPSAKQGLATLEGKGHPGPVTWAGSVHPTGHVYTVGCDVPIRPMPPHLVKAIGAKLPQPEHGDATFKEKMEWGKRFVHTHQNAFSRTDAKADLRLTLRALECELPDMPSGWAARFYRAGANLGPHVAAGGLGYEEATKELTTLFYNLDEDGGDPEHVLRSIERGLAAGARGAKL